MPSVGMRRTTRVFGVVKGADGARLLRSGRLLWPESGDGKLKRANYGEDLFPLMKTTGDGGVGNGAIGCKQKRGVGEGGMGCKQKQKGWVRKNDRLKQEVNAIKTVDSENEVKELKSAKNEAVTADKMLDKMCGKVYSRKRKRLGVQKSDFSGNSEEVFEHKMYGNHFSRRQRKSNKQSDILVVSDSCASHVFEHCRLFAVIESSGSVWFASFLNLVLRYMKRASVRLSELLGLLLSKPIGEVYLSHGVRFLRDPTVAIRAGVCRLFGSKQYTPLFSLDFSAVPICFMHLHSTMVFQSKCLPFFLVNNSMGEHTNADILSEHKENYSCISSDEDVDERKTMASKLYSTGNGPVLHLSCTGKTIASGADDSVSRPALHPCVQASKLAGRSAQFRNCLNSRGIQKRRSSLRSRRGRNHSQVALRRPNGALASELISIRKNGLSFSSAAFNNKLRRSARSSSAGIFREVSSTRVGLAQDIDSSFCSANILIIESDKCYREEGATVMLEISHSREWHLVVKKDGITRYTLKAQKDMKPCSCNRFTHAITWTVDEGWKLEFPARQDWFVFKDLYKECSDRNVPASPVKIIPVPWVQEVSGYRDSNTAAFSRPDLYITMKDDEVSRALAKRTASYDMDYEDEEWLKNFNNDILVENELCLHVSEESFELMIDAFEKDFYCSPDDYSDEKVVANHFKELGRREVVEAVYSYWMKKRKQKRSALVRVFQSYQPRKAPLIPKPALRKRRSFIKRQPSKCGRGKHPIVLQAIAAEQNALEQRNAMIKVEEAKVSANRSVESAILKRKRAQFLAENADLAIYKATVAIRIAEAARDAESTDAVAAHFLD